MTQSRKQANLEIEKKRKQKRGLMWLAAAGVGLIIVAAIVFAFVDTHSRRWIMDLNGERIATGDYQFFAFNFGVPQGADEETKNLVLHDLKGSLLMIERANALGLGFTAEEQTEMLDLAQMYRSWFPDGSLDFITDARMADFFGVDFLQQRLMDHYVPDYTPDAEEFEATLEQHVLDNAESFITRNVLHILSYSQEGLQEAMDMYEAGTDIYDVITMHSVACTDEDCLEPISIEDLDARHALNDDDYFALFGLEQGEFSNIIELEDGRFLLVYMVERHETPEDEIEADFREEFTLARRGELFHEMHQGWIEAADVTINRRTFNRL